MSVCLREPRGRADPWSFMRLCSQRQRFRVDSFTPFSYAWCIWCSTAILAEGTAAAGFEIRILSRDHGVVCESDHCAGAVS